LLAIILKDSKRLLGHVHLVEEGGPHSQGLLILVFYGLRVPQLALRVDRCCLRRCH